MLSGLGDFDISSITGGDFDIGALTEMLGGLSDIDISSLKAVSYTHLYSGAFGDYSSFSDELEHLSDPEEEEAKHMEKKPSLLQKLASAQYIVWSVICLLYTSRCV